MRGFIFAWVFLFGTANVLATDNDASPVDFAKIDEALHSDEGLKAEVHGVDIEHNLFTIQYPPITIRNFKILPILGQDEEVAGDIGKLHRRDMVTVKGELIDNPHVPEKHIRVESIAVTQPFHSVYDMPDYEHKVTLPKDLKDKTEIVAKVHAVVEDGNVMVVEYKDTIIPVEVPRPALVKDLHRGDVLNLHISIAKFPKKPTHIQLDDNDQAVEVLQSLVARNRMPLDECGTLVFYEKSPSIRTNVFALQHLITDDKHDTEGLSWTFTLINSDVADHPEKFLAIIAKLQDEWDKDKKDIVHGRNSFFNPKIQVCAHGIVNEEDPSQANPNLFVQSADDITFKESF